MIQEEKQLLLKDICARLPYGVNVEIKGTYDDGERYIRISELDFTMLGYMYDDDSSIIPYLRPMSSMTEEEKKELRELCEKDLSEYAKFIRDGHGLSHDGLYMFYPLRQLDFLNSHHFDFHGLIQNGLALEAPKDMYKTE